MLMKVSNKMGIFTDKKCKRTRNDVRVPYMVKYNGYWIRLSQTIIH